jgi:hypothetical protein
VFHVDPQLIILMRAQMASRFESGGIHSRNHLVKGTGGLPVPSRAVDVANPGNFLGYVPPFLRCTPEGRGARLCVWVVPARKAKGPFSGSEQAPPEQKARRIPKGEVRRITRQNLAI